MFKMKEQLMQGKVREKLNIGLSKNQIMTNNIMFFSLIPLRIQPVEIAIFFEN